ncbi:hypothetical protein [Streptomyces curacoi]|uniref:hypothetical protein n=1 Tax=Streptomyces curacoi TaxID=146536 RepID=UPI00078501F1|nr:hypothetical protein [Streptomyces curacoi]
MVRARHPLPCLATLLWLPVTVGGTVAVVAALLAVFPEADWSWIVTAAAGFVAVYRLAVHKWEYAKNLVRVSIRSMLIERSEESHEPQEDRTDRPGRGEG